MSIEFLPPEILLEIFSYFSFRELVRIEHTNTIFRHLIRGITFEKELVGLDKNQIEMLLTRYRLVSLNLFYKDITDTDIEKISTLLHKKRLHIKRLILWDCKKITDEGLKSLSHCVNLNLTGCKKITDEGLKSLSNCARLNLTGCKKITDEGLKSLSNCTELILIGWSQITKEGINALKKRRVKIIR